MLKANTELLATKSYSKGPRGHSKLVGDWFKGKKKAFFSPHHRMVEVGRVLWVHLLPSPPQQGHWEHGYQHHVQVALGGPQGGDPKTFLDPCASIVSPVQ